MKPCSLSEEEKKRVENLREHVKDELTPYYDTDFNLLRWLQGHNNNLDIVVPKLKGHLRFRRSDWDLDKIADKPRDHPLHNYWKVGLTGTASKTPNVVVNIEQTGRNDYWGMMLTYSISEILRARLHDLETMLRRVMELEQQSGQQASVMYIMDLTDLKYNKRLLDLISGGLSGISAFMSEHYVELIHTFVLVNAPPFIATIWTLARPLLPERTRNKVRILGGNWKNEILDIAVPEVLPMFWNDNQTQIFKAEMELAEPVEPSNYYKGGVDEHAKTLSIAAGQSDTVDIEARKGTKLEWRIHGDGHFGFTIYFAKDDQTTALNSMTNIYPLFMKIPGPTLVPLGDQLTCAETGVYRFWFSNQHAWWHTLNIRYVITCEEK